MIFATVGTQLPFPRFIGLLDDIAARHDLDIVAQTCDPEACPQRIETRAQMAPAEFDGVVARCSFIVGHAGIGTILSALRARKPVILFPRRAALGEHRNDHQLATIESFRGRDGIYVAEDGETLEDLILKDDLEAAGLRATPSRTALTMRLRAFIEMDG